MEGRVSNLVIFFSITILAILAVEGAYKAWEYFVLKPFSISNIRPQQEPEKTRNQKNYQGKKADYRIIMKRNLFAKSLENSESIPPNIVPDIIGKNINELGIVLMGTIIGTKNNNRAIIRTKQTRDQELFSIGDVIEGALIKDIHPIILSRFPKYTKTSEL